MNTSALSQFESILQLGNPLKQMWDEFHPYLNKGKVDSREKAYTLFSKALKISQGVAKQDSLKELWLDLLSQGSFSLCLEGHEPINYRFNTITELLKSGREAFEVELVEINPKTADLENSAQAIHNIALESLGDSPGVKYFQTKLASPHTFCLMAQERETSIACTYGTYVELPAVNLFHINILGRKMEYPSVRIIDNLQGQIKRLQTRFPKVQYLTLCVEVKNDRMRLIYQDLGFEQIDYAEKNFRNEPIYFYAKKIDPNSSVLPPSHQEFRAAYRAQEAKEQKST